MAEEKRKKPSFLRRDWYKKIKFGKGVKKNQKWRAAKGRHNKTRLGRKGYGKRPKIGYGENNHLKNTIKGSLPLRVQNLKEIENLKAGQGILVASVGKKKRQEILTKAKEKKLIILNKYRSKENESIK